MTREQFAQIDSWGELLSVAWDYGYDDLVCDYYSEESLDDYVNSELEYLAENNDWYEVRNILNDIPEGGYYYRVQGITDIYELEDGDDEFYDIKDELRTYLEDNDEFEDDDDSEYYDEWDSVPETSDDSEFVPEVACEEEPINFSQLVAVSQSSIQTITDSSSDSTDVDNDESDLDYDEEYLEDFEF